MNLCIDIGSDSYTLKFKILDTPLAELWLERMQAKDKYLLDHPDRFYGFSSQQQEIKRAEIQLTKNVNIINQYQTIIHKQVNVYDQDSLNYLHNIFEKYHGLLDQQHHPFWNQAPDKVKRALAELNLNVHRAESAIRGMQPRFVCTWFGLPKTKTLPIGLMSQYGVLDATFGTVYLNYVEIGKTLEDLTEDNDQYISDNAFRPFDHYSADFNVKFTDEISGKVSRMEQYFNQHQEFFKSKGYNSFNNPKLLPLRFPVAELIITKDKDQIIADIAVRQHINQVYFE